MRRGDRARLLNHWVVLVAFGSVLAICGSCCAYARVEPPLNLPIFLGLPGTRSPFHGAWILSIHAALVLPSLVRAYIPAGSALPPVWAVGTAVLCAIATLIALWDVNAGFPETVPWSAFREDPDPAEAFWGPQRYFVEGRWMPRGVLYACAAAFAGSLGYWRASVRLRHVMSARRSAELQQAFD
jgi:hypothetical protein